MDEGQKMAMRLLFAASPMMPEKVIDKLGNKIGAGGEGVVFSGQRLRQSRRLQLPGSPMTRLQELRAARQEGKTAAAAGRCIPVAIKVMEAPAESAKEVQAFCRSAQLNAVLWASAVYAHLVRSVTDLYLRHYQRGNKKYVLALELTELADCSMTHHVNTVFASTHTSVEALNYPVELGRGLPQLWLVEVLYLLVPVATMTSLLRSADILHRDIKLDNIVWQGGPGTGLPGQASFVDFATGRFASAPSGMQGPYTMDVKGTHGVKPPERDMARELLFLEAGEATSACTNERLQAALTALYILLPPQALRAYAALFGSVWQSFADDCKGDFADLFAWDFHCVSFPSAALGSLLLSESLCALSKQQEKDRERAGSQAQAQKRRQRQPSQPLPPALGALEVLLGQAAPMQDAVERQAELGAKVRMALGFMAVRQPALGSIRNGSACASQLLQKLEGAWQGRGVGLMRKVNVLDVTGLSSAAAKPGAASLVRVLVQLYSHTAELVARGKDLIESLGPGGELPASWQPNSVALALVEAVLLYQDNLNGSGGGAAVQQTSALRNMVLGSGRAEDASGPTGDPHNCGPALVLWFERNMCFEDLSVSELLEPLFPLKSSSISAAEAAVSRGMQAATHPHRTRLSTAKAAAAAVKPTAAGVPASTSTKAAAAAAPTDAAGGNAATAGPREAAAVDAAADAEEKEEMECINALKLSPSAAAWSDVTCHLAPPRARRALLGPTEKIHISRLAKLPLLVRKLDDLQYRPPSMAAAAEKLAALRGNSPAATVLRAINQPAPGDYSRMAPQLLKTLLDGLPALESVLARLISQGQQREREMAEKFGPEQLRRLTAASAYSTARMREARRHAAEVDTAKAVAAGRVPAAVAAGGSAGPAALAGLESSGDPGVAGPEASSSSELAEPPTPVAPSPVSATPPEELPMSADVSVELHLLVQKAVDDLEAEGWKPEGSQAAAGTSSPQPVRTLAGAFGDIGRDLAQALTSEHIPDDPDAAVADLEGRASLLSGILRKLRL